MAHPVVQGAALPLDACPSCGGTDLHAVVDTDDLNILCRACGRCWHVELSHVSRVDPLTCCGCPHRNECMTVFGETLS
jgi:hypothetical protein